MSATENWKELACDLEGLLENKIDANHIRNKYEFRSLSSDTQIIIAHVEHFLCDYDLRLKDPQYKEMQELEMKKLIALIRKDGPKEKILNIHFLGETET